MSEGKSGMQRAAAAAAALGLPLGSREVILPLRARQCAHVLVCGEQNSFSGTVSNVNS